MVHKSAQRRDVTTSQHRNVTMSRLHNITKSQRRDIAGKSQQTLFPGEAIKGMGISNLVGSKFVCKARV